MVITYSGVAVSLMLLYRDQCKLDVAVMRSVIVVAVLRPVFVAAVIRSVFCIRISVVAVLRSVLLL